MTVSRRIQCVLAIAVLCVAPAGVAVAQSNTGSTPTAATAPVARIYAKMVEFCLGSRTAGEIFDYSYDDEPGWVREWHFAGTFAGSDYEFLYTFTTAGAFDLVLTIKDRTGASSRDSKTLFVKDCGGSTQTATPSPSCYMDESGKAVCPTPTAATDYPNCYYDSAGKYVCYEPTTTPTTTPPVQNSYCQDLLGRRDQYTADWKTRKYEYYRSSGREFGSDAEYERKMQSEYDAYMAQWDMEWKNGNCDYGGSSTTDECRTRYARAQPDLDALRERFDSQWKQYYVELEQARGTFSSEKHTDEEWKEFETRWSARANAIQDSYDAEMRAIAGQYGLYDCGFQYNDAPDAQPDYQTFGDKPTTTSSYDNAWWKCQQEMSAVKERYGAQFESLYQRLREAREGTSDYDRIQLEIRDLERMVGAEMERIMAECRQDYERTYQEADTYEERQGSLQCYYDEALQRILCQGKYVMFQGNPQTQVLYEINCGGALYFEKFYANVVLEDFQMSQGEEGGQLSIVSEKLRVIFHDNPRGIINVGVVGDAMVSVVPAAYLEATMDGDNLVLKGKEGLSGVWMGTPGALRWDAGNRALQILGEAKWIAESCFPDGASPDGDQGDQYWDAIRKKKLGAQVVVTEEGGSVGQDDESYSDVGVDVKKEGGSKYVATVDSLEGTCKTVVLKFDRGIFSSIDLSIHIESKNADGTFSALDAREADDLADILEPCDDGENGFEYYVVQDKFGTQILLSFAHFSEKRVSVEAASVSNVIVPGLGAGLVAVAATIGLAAVAAFRRRLTR